ncbi:MAG: BON domain-containing protein [Gemmataceae bacterium]
MTATIAFPTQDAAQALTRSSQPELRRLVVKADPDVIVLTGNVSSFYLKQLAQETVKLAASGRRIINNVVVRG